MLLNIGLNGRGCRFQRHFSVLIQAVNLNRGGAPGKNNAALFSQDAYRRVRQTNGIVVRNRLPRYNAQKQPAVLVFVLLYV